VSFLFDFHPLKQSASRATVRSEEIIIRNLENEDVSRLIDELSLFLCTGKKNFLEF